MAARLAVAAAGLVAACASAPAPDRSSPAATADNPVFDAIDLAEPGQREVIVVINDNAVGGRHAGVFAGTRLSDPSGTYRHVRSEDAAWRGPTLRDYVNFQLLDGSKVRAYRFTLPQAEFAAIESRMANAGWTMPLFCAAKVQDYLAGVGPFGSLETTWWTSPKELGRQLDSIIRRPGKPGACELPDGKPC